MPSFPNLCNTTFAIALWVALATAGQVGKVSYSGQPETLHGKSVLVPSGSVAMSEEIHVDIPAELLKGGAVDANPSIMFVLDNSGSMWMKDYQMDVQANRYKVTSRLIDSIAKLHPKAEIGLSIFSTTLYCKSSDDKLFKTVNSGDSWGYIPLLKMDSTYTSDKAKTLSGRDMLKYYLKTVATPKVDENPLSYKSGAEVGTNITAGFDGAVAAFKNSSNNKNRQYVIFISDGVARDPSNNTDERDRFMKGVNVPTTFTIYFSKENTVPITIQTMTDAIKANTSLSSNNHLSANYAYNNTTEDDLMKFIMDNIISVITKTTDASVAKISVNGSTVSNWDKTNKKISFGDMIPLTGTTTPFSYKINYKVNDTVVVDGKKTITNIDTTLTTDFTMTTANGIQLKDPYKIQWWDRTLNWTLDGVAGTKLSASKPDGQIRFEEKALDILYGYKEVSVSMRSIKKGDVETISLSKNGNLFTAGFKSDYKGDKAENDGAIQVDRIDTIIATFRNPKLPLDTLEMRIPYEAGTMFSVESSDWFDVNADGFVDSLSVGFSYTGALSAEQVTELTNRLILAPNRRFETIKSSWNNGKLNILVKENNAIPNTQIGVGDTVALRDGILTSGGLTFVSSVLANDHLAPVILDGSVILNDQAGIENDLLTVRYSEPVTESSATGQYLDFRRGSSRFTVQLTPKSTSNETVVYNVASLPANYFMTTGDSVRIAGSTGLVKDTKGIVQKNSANIERPLLVTSSLVLSKGVFFDGNADGLVDSVAIEFSTGEGSTLSAEDLIPLISLPRSISIDKSSVVKNRLILSVKQNSGGMSTAILPSETIVLRESVLSNGTKTAKSSIVPIDSMAPVILNNPILNDLTGTADDRLTVQFSEPVASMTNSGRYFDFRRGTKFYTAELKPLNVTGADVQFAVVSLSEKNMVSGDSLRINGIAGLVADLKGNVQKNSANIERELVVTSSVILTGSTFYDRSGDGLIDSVTIDFATGEGSDIKADDLLKLIDLPASRKLTIDRSTMVGTRLILAVTENSIAPSTAITDSDSITLRSGMAGTAKVESAHRILPVDSIAPVIMPEGVTLYDYPGAGDTLHTTFSEPVAVEKVSAKQFSIRRGAAPYDLYLTPIRSEQNSVIWQVDFSGKPINEGDSIRINASMRQIRDVVGAVQGNSTNREERVNVIAAVEIRDAHYYDNSGDGLIDSIAFSVVTGEGAQINADDLRAKITLPAFRNFTVEKAVYSGTTLSFTVKENRPTPNTAITAEDRIKIAKGALGSAIVLTDVSLTPVDHLAPVILHDGALYRDFDSSREDSLTVTFSESLAPMTLTGEPFALRRGTAPYAMVLSPVVQNGSTLTFVVVRSAPIATPLSGDSIKIDAAKLMVRDSANNVQTNPLNAERSLRVVTSIQPLSAVWFDRNADGFIDELAVELLAGGAIFASPASQVASLLTLPAERKFSLGKAAFIDKKLVVTLSEGSLVPNTATTATDRIGMVSASSSIEVVGLAQLAPVDSVAPVILPGGAVLEDSLSGTDYLTVNYSEPVTVSGESAQSHLFVNGLSPYAVVLSKLSQDSLGIRYKVDSSTRPDSSIGYDSIWINSAMGTIKDLVGNVQTNSANIRRELDLKLFVNPFDIVINAVTPYRLGVTPVPAELDLPAFDLDESEIGGKSGMIIQAQAIMTGTSAALPRMNLEGELMIYDAVGNIVMKTRSMVYVPAFQSLFFVWNGKNESGRQVGSGTYAARVQVRAATENREFSKEFGRNFMLGIQGIPPVE